VKTTASAAAIAALVVCSISAQPAQAPARAKPAARAGTVAARTVKDLRYPPLSEVKIPDVETFTLSNGLKVFLLENHELPLVNGSVRFHTGSVYDPPDKAGLADMVDEVLRTGGTKEKTGDEIDEQLENVAASIETSFSATSGSVSFNCLRENVDEVMALFRDFVIAPEFREDKLELAKTQARSIIARRNDNANGILGREFRELLYGKDTAWGRRMEYATIDRIGRADLAAFHKRYFFPANGLVSIYGDFSAADMKARLEKLFGGWSNPQEAVPALPPVPAKAAAGAYLATKNDVEQAFFAAGHLGGTLRDKDYAALDVMADVLGNTPNGRLYRRVRTEKGLAYHVGASWHANYNYPGMFQVTGSTKSASAVETLEIIRQEIEKIRTTEVTDQELETAKNSTLNSFVFNFSHPRQTLERLATYEFYGYPRDFLFTYQKAVAAVTKADVLRVAKERIKPSEMTIVVVGKPSDFDKPLSALNLPVTNIDLTIPEPKRERAAADAGSLARGKEMLRKAQSAMGGVEKLAWRDYMHTADVEVTAGGMPMKLKQTTRIAGNHARVEQELPFGKVTVYTDGKSGWLASPQGTQALPDAVLKQVGGEMFRRLNSLLLSDRDPERTVNAVGPDVIEISDQQGHSVRVQLDPSSGLPVKTTYRGQQGADSEDTYSEWKEVGGVKLPHKTVTTQGGKRMAESKIAEIRINSGITAEELSQKP